MSNYTVVATVAQEPVWTVAPVFMLDLSGELVNESRTGKRDSGGKFLKLHVKMETVAATFSSSDVELASRFGADVDELFLGRR